QYVRLMQARFPGALAWEVVLAPGVEDVLVPSMALQPLVENAVRHGALATRGAGRVQLTASIVRAGAGEALELRLHDDGPGLAAGGAAPGEGTGLSATRTRLALLHGARGELEARNAPEGGFDVVMRLPARRHAARTEDAVGAEAAAHAGHGR
ncbi:MAG TPA: ATP-binding protein, partial [Gemmatimonadaceae bacterium]|nr:ATP-binding protein [Gemmatimonadaceae bacterium]